MKHLGDITKINGAEIEVVDVITGGSPCQDLSIAGKRAGLAGARSGLFMEQIRIVKEMREHDRESGRTGDMVRPRFMVWENVPGAFSSNKGQDFAAVLEEIIRIAEPEAPDIEVPEKGWNTWGGYHDEVGGRWSVAWRVHDAQYWGVPQRCRRISVVADFGGDTAAEILFERKSVSRHPAESGTAREEVAGGFGTGADCAGADLICMATQQGGAEIRTGDRAPTLTGAVGMSGNNQPVVCAGFKLGNSEQARSIGYAEEQSPTLNAECGGNKPAVVALDMSHACDAIRDCGEVAPSLQARMGTGGNQVPLTYQDVTGTLSPGAHAGSYNGQDAYNDMLVCGENSQQAFTQKRFAEYDRDENAVSLRASGGDYGGGSECLVTRQNMIVRRLTPMECERLQGFPDHWTDIGEWRDSKGKLRKDADSPRYKALGNSIALPFWDFLAKRISAQYLRPVTMGSLFDGISGFCLCFARWNGVISCRWASEIEEFPIAVAKKHFGDEETGEVGDIERILRSDKKENV